MGFFKSLFGGSNTPETEKEKNDKKNFEILKYDGIRARHMGKLPYAIKCFEEAVAINDEMETLTLLANAYIQANRLDDARITFNRMAEKEPEQVNTFLSLASICFMQEDYEGMNDACQKALALDDKNPLTYYLTAKAAVGMKEEINAIAMLTKAIVLKEDYTEAYQLRAEVLWGMKQAKDAAEDIQKLLNLNPEDEQALLLKGEILAEPVKRNRQKNVSIKYCRSILLTKRHICCWESFSLQRKTSTRPSEYMMKPSKSIPTLHKPITNEVASNC